MLKRVCDLCEVMINDNNYAHVELVFKPDAIVSTVVNKDLCETCARRFNKMFKHFMPGAEEDD